MYSYVLNLIIISLFLYLWYFRKLSFYLHFSTTGIRVSIAFFQELHCLVFHLVSSSIDEKAHGCMTWRCQVCSWTKLASRCGLLSSHSQIVQVLHFIELEEQFLMKKFVKKQVVSLLVLPKSKIKGREITCFQCGWKGHK